MTTPKLVKKLSLKTICGLARGDDAKAFMAKLAKNNTQLAVIAGEVTGHGSSATQYGKSVFLIGDFMAKNLDTGAIFEAGKLYLPKDTAETIVAVFDSRQSVDQSIEFKLSVTVTEDASSAVGYTYVVSPVRSAEAVSKRQALLDSVSGAEKVAQIAAPAKKKA